MNHEKHGKAQSDYFVKHVLRHTSIKLEPDGPERITCDYDNSEISLISGKIGDFCYTFGGQQRNFKYLLWKFQKLKLVRIQHLHCAPMGGSHKNPCWTRESEQAVDCPRFNIYIVHQWENWTPYFYIVTDMCWNINFKSLRWVRNHSTMQTGCAIAFFTTAWPVNHTNHSWLKKTMLQYAKCDGSVTLIIRMQCSCVLHDGIERRIYVNTYIHGTDWKVKINKDPTLWILCQ